jgi:hypothetical protein
VYFLSFAIDKNRKNAGELHGFLQKIILSYNAIIFWRIKADARVNKIIWRLKAVEKQNNQ